jgi:hypothetical protein
VRACCLATQLPARVHTSHGHQLLHVPRSLLHAWLPLHLMLLMMTAGCSSRSTSAAAGWAGHWIWAVECSVQR